MRSASTRSSAAGIRSSLAASTCPPTDSRISSWPCGRHGSETRGWCSRSHLDRRSRTSSSSSSSWRPGSSDRSSIGPTHWRTWSRRRGTSKRSRRQATSASLCEAGRKRSKHMIFGAHVIVYSRDPTADRAFFRDVLGLPSVDAGHDWLIFALPPAEMAALADKNVLCSELEEARWGSVTKIQLPGGGVIRLYQRKHPSPLVPNSQ